MAVASAAAAAAAGEEEPEECAICFDDLAAKGGAVTLPCACRVAYCSSCWDRALNAKFERKRRAECPSCRTALRVDFDPARACLTFQRSDGMPDPTMRNRLYEQARPVQIKLLEGHGARLKEAEVTPSAAAAESPRCVCGSRLISCSVRARVIAFVANLSPSEAAGPVQLDAREESVVGHYLMKNRVPITCDICDRKFEPTGNTWTCENGKLTILHGLAYDVCEPCFMRYVHGVEPPPPLAPSEERDDEEPSTSQDAQGAVAMVMADSDLESLEEDEEDESDEFLGDLDTGDELIGALEGDGVDSLGAYPGDGGDEQPRPAEGGSW